MRKRKPSRISGGFVCSPLLSDNDNPIVSATGGNCSGGIGVHKCWTMSAGIVPCVCRSFCVACSCRNAFSHAVSAAIQSFMIHLDGDFFGTNESEGKLNGGQRVQSSGDAVFVDIRNNVICILGLAAVYNLLFAAGGAGTVGAVIVTCPVTPAMVCTTSVAAVVGQLINITGFSLAAGAAGTGLLTLCVNGGLLGHRPVAPAMTQSGGFAIGVALAAAAAGVGRVALIVAGRSSNLAGVVMTQSSRLVARVAVSAGTLVGRVTLGVTGGIGHSLAIAVSMGRQLLGVIVLVGLAAGLTGMQVIALSSFSGCYGLGLVLMTICLDLIVLVTVTTVLTGVGRVALGSTGRLGYLLIVIMTSCLDRAVRIRVTTFAGMGGVTLGSTGGLSYLGLVAVLMGRLSLTLGGQLIGVVVLVAMTAPLAFMQGVTLGSRGGRDYSMLVVVTRSRNFAVLVGVTTGAGVGGVALILASRSGDLRFVVVLMLSLSGLVRFLRRSGCCGGFFGEFLCRCSGFFGLGCGFRCADRSISRGF